MAARTGEAAEEAVGQTAGQVAGRAGRAGRGGSWRRRAARLPALAGMLMALLAAPMTDPALAQDQDGPVRPRPGLPSFGGAAPGALAPRAPASGALTPGASGALTPGASAPGVPGGFGPPTGLPAAPRPVPMTGAGNFCFQPAGICGPACSISCQDGRTAYCDSGLGSRPGLVAGAGGPGLASPGAAGSGPAGFGVAPGSLGGSLAPGAAAGCAGPPRCSCR